MAIIETTKSATANNTTTLNGKVSLNESEGALVVRDITNEPIVRLDDDGFHIYNSLGVEIISITTGGFRQYDQNGNELITLDQSGLVVREANGRKRVRAGQNPADSTNYGFFASKEGVDVDAALEGTA